MPITLLLSGDAYQGPPIADLTLDGVALPSVPVTVVNGSGVQAVTIDAAPGPHTLVLGFANDAWGGTADTDRNLYLDGIKGVVEAVPSHAFMANGTLTLMLTVPDDAATYQARIDRDLATATAALTDAAAASAQLHALSERPDPMPVFTTPIGIYNPGHATIIPPVVGALPAITVSPTSPTFAVGASGTFATLSAVPAGATRTISGDGRVVLGAAGGTLVVGMTAATAGTSVPVTITDAKAGMPSVTLTLSISVTAVVPVLPLGITSSVVNPGSDGFGPGIYGPTTVYGNPNSVGTSVVASWFARLETKGPQVWTLSGDTAPNCYAGGVNGGFLLYYFQPPVGTHAMLWTVTDGQTTKTFSFNLISTADAIITNSNYVLDASAINGPGWYGSALTAQVPPAWHFSGDSFYYGNPPVLTDPNGFVQVDGFSGIGMATTSAGSSRTPAHYGAYTGATFTKPSVPAFTQPFSYWIAQEQPAAMRFDILNAYDYAVVGDVLGVLHVTSDAGIQKLEIVSSGQPLTIAANGTVRFAAAPVAAATIALVIRATSNNQVTTTLSTSYTISVGTTLPASNLTMALSTTLDNSLTTEIYTHNTYIPGPTSIGTVQVSGMTAPVMSFTQVNGLLLDTGGTPMPMFSATQRAGNPLLFDIAANFLSGQVYQVQAVAMQGALICRSPTTLTVANLNSTGPIIDVSPGALDTATTAPRWNTAMDRYWSNPVAYKGCTIRLPGGPYVITTDPDGTRDFNRHGLGHGNNQQYPPGPYTLCGPADVSNPTIIAMNGAPGLSAQGGLIAQGGDIVFRNLIVKNVSNANAGEGNAGAFYKTGGQPYDLLIEDCKAYNSDNGFLSGTSNVSNITWRRCVFAFNGIGAGGLTHNFYVGHDAVTTLDHILSFSTAQVHECKSRSRETHITNSTFADGQNGNPGSSSCLDFPNGGIVTVTNTTLHKGPAPNNDGNMVQYAEEAPGANGPAWDVNTMVLDGVTFLNTAAPGSFLSQVIGINFMQGGSTPALSPIDGTPATIVYRNCRFYNLPRDQWATQSAPGNTVTDGGGNVHLTDWPGLQAIDPSTDVLLTQAHKPGPGYDLGYIAIANSQGIVVDSLELETRIVAGAAVGVQVTQMFALDQQGNALTAQAWTLPGNQVNTGAFSIESATGIVRVAQAGLVDGLRWVYATCTGNNTATVPVSVTYGKYISVIVGTGHVPGLATVGGAVQAA